MKKILIFMLAGILLNGCATTSNMYGNIYNDAVANGKSITIMKEDEFADIKAKVNDSLNSVGYKKVFYSSPKQGFMVLVKDIPLAKALLIGDAHPYKIILKYTKAGEGKTRIDLVNGSQGLFTKGEVEQDIQRLSEEIRKD